MKNQYTGSQGLREPNHQYSNPMINVAISELDESHDICDENMNHEYS